MIKKKAPKAPNKKSGIHEPIKEYVQVLTDIKKHVQESQIKAVISANTELLKLYWSIGKIITEKQQLNGWGTKVIEKLANDLQSEFPGISGFSKLNLFRMRAFYRAYEKVSQAVTQLEDLPIFKIPWGHNVLLMHKLNDIKECLWYAQKTTEQGWSRVTLEVFIKSNLYRREGKSITNFKATLPDPHSSLAQQTLKDPYIFDFLTLHDNHVEKDVERGLIDHIQKCLLELGQGFAFIGRQVHLAVDNKDYYIDLLFYHVKLHCYVVVELKAREFDPRDAGQISFYLAAVDDTLKDADDKPTIGLLLCKSKSKLTVEYALRSNISPIAVSSYEAKLVESLPKNLKSSLPTVAEIEAELEKQEWLSKKQSVKSKSKK